MRELLAAPLASVSAAAAGSSSSTGPAEELGLLSTNGADTEACLLRFVHHGPPGCGVVRCLWVDLSGEEQQYQELVQGQAQPQRESCLVGTSGAHYIMSTIIN